MADERVRAHTLVNVLMESTKLHGSSLYIKNMVKICMRECVNFTFFSEAILMEQQNKLQ